MNLFLDLPENFHFRRTVYSHGWYSLLPFELDKNNWQLSRVFSGRELKRPVWATVTEENEKLKIEIPEADISPEEQSKILRDVRHILRLDDDLSEFYNFAALETEFAWISETNSGRLLRSPTVYEDLVKTICTTNCSWALTEKMVTNLVEKLGEPAANGKRSFPIAEKMAEVPVEFYREEVRAGYRAPFFAELAEKVAVGKLNPEAWLHTDLPTKELKKQMKQIKGVGDYAAENLLKLVGRYDVLALDSWVRSQFYKKRNAGQTCDDKEISRFYERFNNWRGLVIWCDVTESWFSQ